jgi:hypothetical protein
MEPNRLTIITSRQLLAAFEPRRRKPRERKAFVRRNRKIRSLRAAGLSLNAIGPIFGISTTRVSQVCRGVRP